MSLRLQSLLCSLCLLYRESQSQSRRQNLWWRKERLVRAPRPRYPLSLTAKVYLTMRSHNCVHKIFLYPLLHTVHLVSRSLNSMYRRCRPLSRPLPRVRHPLSLVLPPLPSHCPRCLYRPLCLPRLALSQVCRARQSLQLHRLPAPVCLRLQFLRQSSSRRCQVQRSLSLFGRQRQINHTIHLCSEHRPQHAVWQSQRALMQASKLLFSDRLL